MPRGLATPRRKGKRAAWPVLARGGPGAAGAPLRPGRAGRGSAGGSSGGGRKGPGRAWLRRRASGGGAMSRLREEDDPYVVEEPSDEERALSRCLAGGWTGGGGSGPRSPPGVCWPGRAATLAVPGREQRGSRRCRPRAARRVQEDRPHISRGGSLKPACFYF